MNKILITGVAGMIGSHMLDQLLDNDQVSEVIGIDNLSYGKRENIAHKLNNPKFKFYAIDVCEKDVLKMLCRDVDIILHLAAVKKISEAEPALPTLNVNYLGTLSVLEAAKLWGSKVIFASTSDVYGNSAKIPFSEDDDLLIGPSMIKRWSYAVSKLMAEQLTYAYYKDHGVDMCILRYFGGFSERSSFTWSGGHIPIFINKILNDEEIIIHGDGLQTRSMAHVSDLVSGTLKALFCERAVGHIINIGNEEEISVLDSAYILHRLCNTGREIKIKFIPFEELFGNYKDIMRRKPDLKKARNILGYEPKINFEEGALKVINKLKDYNVS
jgi:UDP-glucose 4-epimerase